MCRSTGELEGLKGTMAIEITAGTHAYEFEYTLPMARSQRSEVSP
jgi:hypothetical protein